MREGVFVVAIGVGIWVLFLTGLTGDASSDLPVAPAPTEVVAASPTPGEPETTGTAGAGSAADSPSGDGDADGSGEVYTIAAGDTLDRVAQRHGVTLQQLLAANPEITDPGRVSVGQRINIPS